MDTFIAWRPWKYSGNEDWCPTVERLHCDQNPIHRKGFHCVQGMVPLCPVNQQSGGLQVVPDTNTDSTQQYLADQYPMVRGDWLQLHPKDRFMGKGNLLLANPGDLILWDSRTIHGGLVGTGENFPNNDFARLSLTVCMAPTSKAKASVIKKTKRSC